MNDIVIYGAYGFTGRLITEELLRIGHRPLLSGRNAAKLGELAQKLNLSYTPVDLDNRVDLHQLLAGSKVVIHAAGPFSATAQPMIDACLVTKTHYIDITGEWQVYEYAQTRSEEATNAGIMLLPGAGFDVVPSDCLANHLKKLLPDATSLQLAFTSINSSVSRGTAKTMIEGAPDGQMYRQDHQLVRKPLGSSVKEIDFGDFSQTCVGISWGDISTAYASTGIPTIEVFTGAPEKQIKKLKWMGKLSFLLKAPFIQNYLKKQVDKRPAGPDANRRKKGEAWFWGKVSDGTVSVEARLKTPEGYSLTALTATAIARNIIDGNFTPGYQTPATAYGDEFITTFPGVGSFF